MATPKSAGPLRGDDGDFNRQINFPNVAVV
jgi:hypothetical protein